MRKFKLILLIILPAMVWCGFAFFGGLQGWWLSPVANNADDFHHYATHHIDTHNKGSAAFVLINNGQLHANYFSSPHKEINEHTVFAAASMSKLLTAIGVMQLANEGKIDLSHSVNAYLKRWKIPSSAYDANQVTVAQLLSHTSGLTDGLGFGDYQASETLPTLIQSLVSPRASTGSREITLGLPAGQEWKYSGGGYLVLQLLIEDVTGQHFESWMQQQLFTPLNMQRSSYQFIGALKNNAGAYDSEGNATTMFQYAAAGATGLVTSAHDLTKLAIALSTPDTKQAHSTAVNLVTAQQIRTPSAQLYDQYIWGNGAMLYAPVKNNDYIYGHDGSNDPAINTAFRINPNNGDAIIVLVTGNSRLASSIAFEWTLWQSGKPDFIMLDRAIHSAFVPASVGMLLWCVALFIYRRKRSTQQQ